MKIKAIKNFHWEIQGSRCDYSYDNEYEVEYCIAVLMKKEGFVEFSEIPKEELMISDVGGNVEIHESANEKIEEVKQDIVYEEVMETIEPEITKYISIEKEEVEEKEEKKRGRKKKEVVDEQFD